MTQFQQLTKRIVEFRAARGWKRYHGPKDMALGMLIEAAEFAELVQYFTGAELKKRIKMRKEALADELVDVLWWVLLNANDLGIDLAEAFERKIKKNEAKYPPLSATDNKHIGKGFVLDRAVGSKK
jgi:NTP pyrophosphatase (non-canonical NTP hydrolase)